MKKEVIMKRIFILICSILCCYLSSYAQPPSWFGLDNEEEREYYNDLMDAGITPNKQEKNKGGGLSDMPLTYLIIGGVIGWFLHRGNDKEKIKGLEESLMKEKEEKEKMKQLLNAVENELFDTKEELGRWMFRPY